MYIYVCMREEELEKECKSCIIVPPPASVPPTWSGGAWAAPGTLTD